MRLLLGAGTSPGYTAPSVRIDYVLHSPDLAATDVVVRPTLVSDHFIVAATLKTQNRER